MSETIMEKALEPYERSIFIRVKGLDSQQSQYDLDDDGIFIQDDFVFIKTIEENFDNPVFVSVRLIKVNTEERSNNEMKLLKSVVLDGTLNTEIFVGNDFTDLSSKDQKFLMPFNKTKFNIYVDSFDTPRFIEVYFLKIT